MNAVMMRHLRPFCEGLGTSSTSEGDRWAIQQLSAGGEDVVGRPAAPQYLLLALVILLTPLGPLILPLAQLSLTKFCRLLCVSFVGSSFRPLRGKVAMLSQHSLTAALPRTRLGSDGGVRHGNLESTDCIFRQHAGVSCSQASAR